MLLEVEKISVHYGKSQAIRDISIKVPENSVVSIIGANGSGKSTIFRALAGLGPLTSGDIYFQGRSVKRWRTEERVKGGLVLVPEGRQLFPYLSVLNNLRLGASLRKNLGDIDEDLEDVYALFPRLQERAKQKAGTLSGGEQQMLAIGRGLMAKPKLLCLDEPSLGLAPIVVTQLGSVIRDINRKGVTVLLVEQNVHLALEAAERCYALEVGRVVLEGDIDEVRRSDIVRKAYLGG